MSPLGCAAYCFVERFHSSPKTYKSIAAGAEPSRSDLSSDSKYSFPSRRVVAAHWSPAQSRLPYSWRLALAVRSPHVVRIECASYLQYARDLSVSSPTQAHSEATAPAGVLRWCRADDLPSHIADPFLSERVKSLNVFRFVCEANQRQQSPRVVGEYLTCNWSRSGRSDSFLC